MLGRLTLYVIVLRLLVLIVQGVLRVTGAGQEGIASLRSWGTGLSVVAVILLLLLAFRWMRQNLLWRVRNRLIVTYMFIGVIPVVLILSMIAIAGYLISVQYATSQSRIELDAETRTLDLANYSVANEISRRVRQHAAMPATNSDAEREFAYLWQRYPEMESFAWLDGKLVYRRPASGRQNAPVVPSWALPHFSGIVLEGGELYLRSVASDAIDQKTLVTLSSVKVSKSLLDMVLGNLLELSLYLPTEVSDARGTRFITRRGGEPNVENPDYEVGQTPVVRGGAVPQHSWAWDPVLAYGTISPYKNWSNGQQAVAIVSVRTRPSALFGRLFSIMGQYATYVVAALAAIAVIFAIIELIALFFGVGLTRTITESVNNLYLATQQVNRGHLKHRIPVKSRDQLADLQVSFNSMTENLEKLIEEQKEKERLESELAIAQEVQATLFPRHLQPISSLDIHGVCQPARTVSGDYYDFLPCGPEQLGIALGDISGKGISAALLMATVHSAVRVYEFGGVPAREQLVRAGASSIAAASEFSGGPQLAVAGGLQSPAAVMSLLNQHIYHSTPTEKYATLFLGVYNGCERSLTYCNAGHLPPLIISAEGSVQRLEISGTVIGLFEGIEYEEHRIVLNPGDIFVAFSDGITEPENEFGEFGEQRLIEIIREHRHSSLDRISEEVVFAVKDWIGGAEQPDDITLVLARAR
jgi:sigma-B regulation protein RsbU (phosphoserine phosphatase)